MQHWGMLVIILCLSGIFGHSDLHFSAGRSPVPNPGAPLKMNATGTRQPFLTDYFPVRIPRREGEGCSETTLTAGADTVFRALSTFPAKCGYPPMMSNSSPISQMPIKAVHKRSFRRACRRALQYGTAHYHGQLMRPQDFPHTVLHQIQSKMQQVPQRHAHVQPKRASTRMNVLLWNPGGMSQSSFQEYVHWLTASPVQIAILVETRWSFVSTWSSGAWHFIHSASHEHRSGGILVMVRNTFASADALGFEKVLPGMFFAASPTTWSSCPEHMGRHAWSQLRSWRSGLQHGQMADSAFDHMCSH